MVGLVGLQLQQKLTQKVESVLGLNHENKTLDKRILNTKISTKK